MPQMKLTRSIGVLKNPNIIQNKKTAIIYMNAAFFDLKSIAIW